MATIAPKKETPYNISYGVTTHNLVADVSGADLRNAATLGKQYGVTYDEATIRNKFDAATKAEYNALNKEYAATENQYGRQLYSAQQSQTDSIRRAMAQGVANGADASTAILSAMTGMQQAGVEGATDLANQRNQLKAQEQAAYSQNAVNALETANSAGMSLGELASTIYGLEIQNRAAEFGYYADLNTAAKNLEGVHFANDIAYTIERNKAQNAGWRDASRSPGGW